MIKIPELTMKWLKAGDMAGSGVYFMARDWAAVFSDPPGINVTVRLGGPQPFKGEDKLVLYIYVAPSDLPIGLDQSALSGQRYPVGDREGGFFRWVYEYVGAESGLPLRAGLTVHEGRGTWSSWPPHDFEMTALQCPVPLPFAEKFAYVTNPPGGWGFQCRKGTIPQAGFALDVISIYDRVILDIPAGSHPVVAGPGFQLAYFWVYITPPGMLPDKFSGGEWV